MRAADWGRSDSRHGPSLTMRWLDSFDTNEAGDGTSADRPAVRSQRDGYSIGSSDSSALAASAELSAARSTGLPDASVIVACSSTSASALLRRTSAYTTGRLPACMIW